MRATTEREVESQELIVKLLVYITVNFLDSFVVVVTSSPSQGMSHIANPWRS